MMTLAKGLAGGFPIGAVLMTDIVAAEVQAGDIAATFGGAPTSMAAMRAVLYEIVRLNLCQHAQEIEEYVREIFAIPQVVRIAGKGCLLGLELDREAKPVQRALIEKGVIVGTNSNRNMIHLLPPLIIEPKHLDVLLGALKDVL
jgi:acetylornithine/succinyldiaminopimelate/putrescine aminotransferase